MFRNRYSGVECGSGEAGTCAFDENLKAKELRQNYLKQFTGHESALVLGKNELLHYQHPGQLIAILVFLGVSFIPVFLISALSNRKDKVALWLMELIECFNLQLVLRKYKIKKLHYFCIYERDANLCALILMKSGIYVNKIPSEVPLVFLNKIIVADQLSLCFAYQKEELEAYKDTMFVSKIEQWGPEQLFEAPKRYFDISMRNKKADFDIGFFSSAYWLREINGDAELSGKDKENEQRLLNALVHYACTNNCTLCIYLHPLEKKAEHLAAVKQFYQNVLSNPKVKLADSTQSSVNGFDNVDVGVSLYSTLMFERIYFGFKTLLAPWGYPDFPLEHTAFRKICAASEEELYSRLRFNLPLSREAFFNENNLFNYSILDSKKNAVN